MAAEPRRHTTLNYAPRQARRLTPRRVVYAAAALMVAAAGMQFGPGLWRSARLHYLERRCMAYTPPAGVKFVYEEAAPTTQPAAGATTQNGPIPPAVFFAKEWEDFYAAFSPPGRQPAVTVFLHERSAGTEPRLVAVELNRVPMQSRNHFDPPRIDVPFNVCIFSRGDWRTLPVQMKNTTVWMSLPVDEGLIFPGRPFALRPGVADANDPSRFRIDVYCDQKRITVIEGFLTNNDDVVMTAKPAP